MRTLCRRARLHYCDLLAQPLARSRKVSGQVARMKPRARPPLNEAYFRRMSAIEFAVKHDDGVGAGLHGADIVLVGVSRTSKTPLSIYLGYLGYKTANVPLVKGIEPPTELFNDRPGEGRRADDRRRAPLRHPRSSAIRWMRGDHKYASLLEIYEELDFAVADPPAARLPGDRGERAVDRGDLAPDHPLGRAARGRGAAAPVRQS